MSRRASRAVSWGVGAALLGLVAAACGAEALGVVPSGGPDWSRGLVLGDSSLNNPIPILLGAEGATLGWIDLERSVRLAGIDGAGRVAWTRKVTAGTPFPHHPYLHRTPEGTITLLWRAVQDGVEALYRRSLDREGKAVGPSARVSDPDSDLEEVAIAGTPRGLEVFWGSASGEGGIRHLGLHHDGSLRSPSRRVVREGFAPQAAWDGEATVHLAWWASVAEGTRELRYGTFDLEADALTASWALNRLSYQRWQRPSGPAIGLEPNWVTVFWSLESLGSASPDSAASYLRFPIRAPASADPQPIWLPRHSEPEYRPVQSHLGYRNLADATVPAFGTNYVGLPHPLEAEGSGLVTAQEVLLHAGSEIRQQIALTAFAAGELLGYEVITGGRGASLQPSLVLDARGDLHASWLETGGFGQYRVVYASTSPQTIANLEGATLRETGGRVLDTGFSLLLVVLYTPLMATWVAPALAWLVAFFVATGEERLEGLRSWGALLLAIGLETSVMAYLPPTTLVALPWAGYVPAGLARWAAPIPLAAVAALALLAYARRQGRRSLFLAFFIFAGIHTVLRIWLHLLTTAALG